MRVIFLGTPEFSVNSLEAIYQSCHEVAAVVTQPDRVNARGKKINFSPVKTFALEHGIPVLQYENISRDGEEDLKKYNADIMVTAAYGQILRENILNLCPKGIINVHASILPKYRGSSPVQWALINGEKRVGVTIMQTEKGIDTGDIILTDGIDLDGTEDSGQTLNKLSILGAKLIVEALNKIADGTASFRKQEESEATHCRMIKKEDGKLDFCKTAEEVVNFIRGMNPAPSTFTDTENGRIKVTAAKVAEGNSENALCGQILSADGKSGLVIACRQGCVEILRLKPENGKEMDARAYLLGKKLTVGRILGE